MIKDLASLHLTNCLLVELSRKFNLSLQNVLIDVHGIVIGEWIDADIHFVDEDTECPPVDRFSMSLVEKDLRSKVLGGSTERKRPGLDDFGEAEVCQFQIAIFANKKILWFQVSIDNVLRMEILEDQGNLCCILSRIMMGHTRRGRWAGCQHSSDT